MSKCTTKDDPFMVGLRQQLFPESFWQEIQPYTKIIIPISGGYESTAIAQEFFNRGFTNVTLLWNNTWRELKSARDTIKAMVEKTNYPLVITEPQPLKGMTKQAFQKFIQLDTAKKLYEILEAGKEYNKKQFRCCYHLKDKPFQSWLKKNAVGNETIVISGLAAYEGNQRRLWLATLRNKDTFIHTHTTKGGVNVAYPFRDLRKQHDEELLEEFLHKSCFPEIKHSGCVECPVVALYPKSESDQLRIERSLKKFKLTQEQITDLTKEFEQLMKEAREEFV